MCRAAVVWRGVAWREAWREAGAGGGGGGGGGGLSHIFCLFFHVKGHNTE